LRVLEGHSARVWSVAFSAEGGRALSGALNGVIRVWDVTDPALRASLAAESPAAQGEPYGPSQVQYTNAKVLLVGDTNAGKTGLTQRLAHDEPPQRGPSTSGAWATQWPLKDLPQEAGWEREVWLWDFGGQADQRLIHQLYLDRTALVLLTFDSDKEIFLHQDFGNGNRPLRGPRCTLPRRFLWLVAPMSAAVSTVRRLVPSRGKWLRVFRDQRPNRKRHPRTAKGHAGKDSVE
jgi:GTPase SAR1 family protein